MIPQALVVNFSGLLRHAVLRIKGSLITAVFSILLSPVRCPLGADARLDADAVGYRRHTASS
jgi:hypothetical protein